MTPRLYAPDGVGRLGWCTSIRSIVNLVALGVPREELLALSAKWLPLQRPHEALSRLLKHIVSVGAMSNEGVRGTIGVLTEAEKDEVVRTLHARRWWRIAEEDAEGVASNSRLPEARSA